MASRMIALALVAGLLYIAFHSYQAAAYSSAAYYLFALIFTALALFLLAYAARTEDTRP